MWDKNRNFPEINNDNNGESLLLINTEKGREIFEAIKDRLHYFKTTVDRLMQPNLREPSKIHSQAKQFAEHYEKYGFEQTLKHFAFIGWRFRMKQLKNKVARIIKKCKKK